MEAQENYPFYRSSAVRRPACLRCRHQKLRCPRTEHSSEPCLRCMKAGASCVTEQRSTRSGHSDGNINTGQFWEAPRRTFCLHQTEALHGSVICREQGKNGLGNTYSQSNTAQGSQEPDRAFQGMRSGSPQHSVQGVTRAARRGRQPTTLGLYSRNGEPDANPQDVSYPAHLPDPTTGFDRPGTMLLNSVDEEYGLEGNAWLSGSRSTTTGRLGSNSPDDTTQRLHHLSFQLSSQLKIIEDAMESEISSYSGDAPPGESKNQLARVLDGCSELSAIAKYLLESDAALRHRSAGRNNSDNVFFDDIDYGLDGRPLQLIPENWQDSYIVGTSGHGSELGHEQLQAAEENQSDSSSRPTNTSQFWVDSPTRGRDVDTIVALLLISSYLSILRNLDRILARMRKALLDGNHKTIAALIPPGCQKIASGLYIEPSLLQIKVTLEIITHALGCIEKQLGLRSLHSTDQPEVPVSQRSGLLSNDTMATIVEGAFNHEKIHLHRRDYKTRRSSFSGSDDVLVADPQVSHLLISRMQDIRSIMRSKSSI